VLRSASTAIAKSRMVSSGKTPLLFFAVRFVGSVLNPLRMWFALADSVMTHEKDKLDINGARNRLALLKGGLH
jgi:hypothetical protein